MITGLIFTFYCFLFLVFVFCECLSPCSKAYSSPSAYTDYNKFRRIYFRFFEMFRKSNSNLIFMVSCKNYHEKKSCSHFNKQKLWSILVPFFHSLLLSLFICILNQLDIYFFFSKSQIFFILGD